ncbi:MAG: serine/threonine-protein kinase, partial [Planctomycetota bacterium]
LPFDLGDYVLVEVLGRGGMGIVYLADQKELQRHVAVKMIRSGILASEAEVRRFYTEAQAAARLHHPNIVSVYQFGRRADHHFFSMEYVRGTDLQKKINGETLNPHVAARYVRDVALAIHHAHEKGVLHRDLKPANVLIDPDDHVHVTDFGLAKHIDADSSVTGSGDAVGTPHYMAPEQAVGQSDRATATSDVYSMGAILFAALAGRPPIVGDTVMQTLVNVVHQPPPLLRSLRPEVPADLETIVAKCLEKEPHRRYGSALELADELDRFLIGDPIVARPRSAPIKAFQWLTGVPLFGALAGRRVLNASVSHRRFQAAMLSMMFLVPVILISALLYRNHMRDSMPADVVIAGGIEDGMYNDMSQQISRVLTQKTGVNAFSIPTGGSVENRDRLLAGEFDLAPMQATAVLGDDICVVAPLFYEVIYVLAHQDGGVTSIDDLRGHTIAVGPPTSGSQYSAQLIFESLGIKSSEIQLDQRSWSQLGQGQVPDAAIMCLGKGNALVNQMLASGKWKLLPITQGIEIALDHPTLRQMRIDAQHHPGVGIPESGVATVGTTAFLAARVNAPGELIRATLETLYEQAWSDDMIPKRIAAEWRGLDFHPEARRFFAESVAAGDP